MNMNTLRSTKRLVLLAAAISLASCASEVPDVSPTPAVSRSSQPNAEKSYEYGIYMQKFGSLPESTGVICYTYKIEDDPDKIDVPICGTPDHLKGADIVADTKVTGAGLFSACYHQGDTLVHMSGPTEDKLATNDPRRQLYVGKAVRDITQEAAIKEGCFAVLSTTTLFDAAAHRFNKPLYNIDPANPY